MSDLALYRKYRSQTFDTVVGQEHIVNALKNQVASGRISHAYLFTGTRGTGKTSCAKILSRAVNCLNPQNGNPCNECAACQSALSETAMDILEIDAASNNGVDNIRQLRDECQYSPAQLKMRVYIIDEVHMLSTGAFNAMLKILEEPPAHVLFILATTEIHKVPITILSRCQRYDFRRIPHKVICEHLEKIAYREGFSVSPDAVGFIAKLGDGSMRDAISLLDRCRSETETITYESAISALSIPQNQQIADIWRCMCACNIHGALQEFDTAYNQGRDIVSLFDNLLSLIRDIYIVKSIQNADNIPLSSAFTPAEVQELSALCDLPLLDYFIGIINDTLSRLTRTSVRRMDGEVCLIKLCSRAVAAPPPVEQDLPPFDLPKKAAEPKIPFIPTTPITAAAPPAPPRVAEQAAPPAEPIATPVTTEPVKATASTEKPAETPAPAADSDDFKAKFLGAIGSSVNIATRQLLKSCQVTTVGSMAVVVCDISYMELLHRTSVTQALNAAATALGLTSAKVTDKAPSTAAPSDPGRPKQESGLEELIQSARDLGLYKDQ